MTDIAARARAVPAALRLLVTDACRNYPRASRASPPSRASPLTTPTSSPADGVVWLFASGEGEPAQESDELEGALFTHYWVSSLRGAGDANGDGRVTLAESYDFAYSQTLLRSARSSGVLQHPAAVFDVSEAAPIVLTKTLATGTLVRLPRAADAHYLVYSLGLARRPRRDMGKPRPRGRPSPSPPGRYLVQRTEPRPGRGRVEVSLAAGEARVARPERLPPVQEEQLASKGGAVVLRPNELGVELEAGATRLSDYGGVVGVRYARRWDEWALGLGRRRQLRRREDERRSVTLSSLGGDAFFERRASVGSLDLGLGLGAEADVVWQSLERTDAARVAAAGYPTDACFTGSPPGRWRAPTCARPSPGARGWSSRSRWSALRHLRGDPGRRLDRPGRARRWRQLLTLPEIRPNMVSRMTGSIKRRQARSGASRWRRAWRFPRSPAPRASRST